MVQILVKQQLHLPLIGHEVLPGLLHDLHLAVLDQILDLVLLGLYLREPQQQFEPEVLVVLLTGLEHKRLEIRVEFGVLQFGKVHLSLMQIDHAYFHPPLIASEVPLGCHVDLLRKLHL